MFFIKVFVVYVSLFCGGCCNFTPIDHQLTRERHHIHFPLREAERRTRLSVGVLVWFITGGRVSAGDSPGSLSQAS